MAIDPSSSNPLATSDDLALVDRVLDRRPEALAELYDRYAPLLLAVTRRILASPMDAEEAMQEAFFRVWNQPDRFDSGRTSVSTWLVLVARERALERLRRRRSHDRLASAPSVDRGVETLPGVFLEGAAVKERRQRVQGAMAALSADHKEVLEQAFFEGLSLTEIAEQTRTPLATVRTRALHAMKQLRRELRSEIRELM
ncbi:MAG: sigma-70 family RNA polymerase sigma factor [Thermoanaerobaculia bacterium]